MLISPLDHQYIVAALTQSVLDDVLEVSHVNNTELFTRYLWARDTHHQHVVTCTRTIELTDHSLITVSIHCLQRPAHGGLSLCSYTLPYQCQVSADLQYSSRDLDSTPDLSPLLLDLDLDLGRFAIKFTFNFH